MIKAFTDDGWNDYLHWQAKDRTTLKRVNRLIEDIDRNGNEGIGKPEQLTFNLAGWWSRRIDDKNRLVYRIVDGTIQIASCRFHYGER